MTFVPFLYTVPCGMLELPGLPLSVQRCKEWAEHVPLLQESARCWKGFAVAANQVGQPDAFFVLRDYADLDNPALKFESCTEDWPTFVANPKILNESGKQFGEEGCLSIPHARPSPGIAFFTAKLSRPNRIHVTYRDREGAPQSIVTTGLLARVFCHEIDHLNGVLFTSRLTGKDRERADLNLARLLLT